MVGCGHQTSFSCMILFQPLYNPRPAGGFVLSHHVAYPQKRRSTRIDQAIPVLVQGVGALREPYQEQVSTLTISCHGCTYQSKHEVIQGEIVYLDIKLPVNGSEGCSSKARVKWTQKLGSRERGFQIAVELESAGNIWGIASPPEDWFPLQISAGDESAAPGRELKVVARKEQPFVERIGGSIGSNLQGRRQRNPGNFHPAACKTHGRPG